MKIIIALASVVMVLAEPPIRGTYYFAKQEDAPYPASGWKPDGPSFDLPQKQSEKQQVAPQRQYGAPVKAPQPQYGGPAAAQTEYGAPAKAPQQQYGAPVAPQKQYGSPIVPQRQYGAPVAPQSEYGAPIKAPQNQYGSPSVPERHYGGPVAPQNQYGTPSTPENQYGTPQYPSESSTATDYDETTFPTTESQAEPVDSINELDEQGNVDEQKQGEYYIALPDGRLQRVQYVSRQDIEAMKYFAKIRAENVEPLRGPVYAYQPLQKLQFATTQLEVVPQDQAQVQGAPAKLQVPVAAKLQGAVAEVAVPVSSFSSFANYQPEQRFLVSF
ncbi:protein piccolo [Microplitis demolitor]|uniref:protein piccolo n=1 Tax=Microplitis demolitor TaxID=69319 RepID=UPI00044003E5|nr:protein piccolo [Microplitis demolitor]